ncbi:site-specific integrase [Trinickia violacea]|uniref:Site-specific integrase n=1 Tax=Trinickia violacea TaxID=2571746 RepID=A0A4P8II33_9BURK|nr:site-specific integrase [Trinickia violacea]QCP48338.1 site-specific integrase [Trinickia violacea]
MKHPYLTTRADSTSYYFRRKVPLKLRALLEKTEIWVSLETPCKEAAVARLPAAALEYERLIAPARAAATALASATPAADAWLPRGMRAVDNEPHPYHPTVQPPGTTRLSAVQIPRLVERYRANALANDDENRPTCFVAPHPDAHDDDGHDEEAHRALLLETRRQLRRARAADDFSAMRECVEDHLMWERVWLPAASDEYLQLLKAMTDAHLAVVEEELRRLEGDFCETPELIPLVDHNDTWEAAVRTWVDEAAPRAKTADEVRTQVARFERLVGAMPLSALTPAHVAHFKAACLEQEKVSKSRVNTIVALLSPVINVAMNNKLTTLSANPFARAKFSRKAVRKDADPDAQRDAYTVDELNRLYASRVFVHGHRPGKGAREAAFWLPLLGPHTGARLEDLCLLRTRDVVQHAGVWCLHLHDTKREHQSGEASIMRYVPIHRTLLELGWLDYVASQNRDGLLFPHLNENQYGQLSAVWSNWFSDYLDVDAGLDDARLDFHSFRHTFKTFGRLSGIDNDVIEELLGHAPTSMYGRNQDGERRLPFELLVQGMEKLTFPGLQLAHLPYAGRA